MNYCANCKQSNGLYTYLYTAKKSYKCQHKLQHISSSCALCTINSQRLQKSLPKIGASVVESSSCVYWLIGDSAVRYCWINTKNCDALSCDLPVLMIDSYLPIHRIMDRVKNHILLPPEIFNIVFCYLFPEINAGNNGLCIDHDNMYGVCNDCVFNVTPQCSICGSCMWTNSYDYHYVLKVMKCCNYNISHHHETMISCGESRNHCDNIIDNNSYPSFNICINTCRQLGTWCDICNKCIGHSSPSDNCITHNITTYPHCITCGIHSAYPHCNKCNRHWSCVCNNSELTSFYFVKKHKKRSKLPRCIVKNCNTRTIFPHCFVKNCNEHSQYPHCLIENCANFNGYRRRTKFSAHSEFPHCASCNLHHALK